eukprot:365231-Chlamydomonas_euryale.AAC.8
MIHQLGDHVIAAAALESVGPACMHAPLAALLPPPDPHNQVRTSSLSAASRRLRWRAASGRRVPVGSTRCSPVRAIPRATCCQAQLPPADAQPQRRSAQPAGVDPPDWAPWEPACVSAAAAAGASARRLRRTCQVGSASAAPSSELYLAGRGLPRRTACSPLDALGDPHT